MDRLSRAEGGLTASVLRLAWPAIMVSLLQTAVFLADAILLGRHDHDALASMQVQGPVLWSLLSVGMGMLGGTVALVARASGGGDHDRARAVARASLRVALALGVVVGALGCLGAFAIAAVMTSDDVIRGLSTLYLRVAFVGLPGAALALACAMCLNATGDTRTPFRVGLVTNAVNVALDLLLIGGAQLGPVVVPSLGVAGAATASAVAFTLEAALLLGILARSGRLFDGDPARRAALSTDADAREVRTWRAALCEPWGTETAAHSRLVHRDLHAVSVPALFERVVIHAGFLAFARVINGLGPDGMAANQALIGMEAISFMTAEGFGVAAGTIVGQMLGRGRPERARAGGRRAALLCALACGIFGLLIVALAPWGLMLFADTHDPVAAADLVARARAVTPVLCVAQPLMAWAVVLGHGLRGAGDTRSPLAAAVIGGLVVRVTAAWGLSGPAGLGLVGVWTATTIDWTTRAVMLSARWRKGEWQRAVVEAPSPGARAARGAQDREWDADRWIA